MPLLNVGAAQIHRVEEATTRYPLSMFNADRALVERNAYWLFPRFGDADGSWEMVFQSWIVIMDGKVVVVDPCTGNGRNLPDYPPGHMLDTPFIERFEATGIRPADVDYVFCTHLHMDHCGWNTRLCGDRFVPTFPNARYLMVREEFDRWDPRRPGHRPVAPNKGVFEASVLPVLEAGLADIVSAGHDIMPGLGIVAAAGHTSGHSVLHMCSAEKHAWFTGDAFHHPLELVAPELDAGTCEDFAGTLETRRRLIAQFIASGALIIPAHFPAPYAGYLRGGDGGAVFVPYGD